MSKRSFSRCLIGASMIACAVIVIAGCGDDDDDAPRNDLAKYDSEVVTSWFDLFLKITDSQPLNPPVASRAFAYEGVALYEAVVPGLETHQSLRGQLNDLDSLPERATGEYHWPSSANAALATIARHLYATGRPELLQWIDDREESFASEFELETDSATYARSAAYGEAIGQAISEWADADGFAAQSTCDFTLPVGPGYWVPTPPAFAPPLLPCWGDLRNFVLAFPATCEPPAPPPFNDQDTASAFYAEMKEVFDTTTHLTAEQTEIARFWADGAGTITPPGHWFSILNGLTAGNDWKLDVACEAYAKLGLAVGESFISCWRAKYVHNLLRPVTCIKQVLDPAWNSLIGTPPFPEYTSGHSVQSGASAQVLTDLFGDIAFDDSTHLASGRPTRSFDSFFEAADEAAISRLYGGIHFRSAIEKGVEQGKCIGQAVSALHFLR